MLSEVNKTRDKITQAYTHIQQKAHEQQYLERRGLGIRGTHLKSSIQDIVDEVAPIKKAPLWGWGPIHSNVMSLDYFGAFDSTSGIKFPKNSHSSYSCIFFIRTDGFKWVPQIPGRRRASCDVVASSCTTFILFLWFLQTRWDNLYPSSNHRCGLILTLLFHIPLPIHFYRLRVI